MTRLSENKQNQPVGQPGTESGPEKKKFSFSVGTVLFLSFNFLLVLGLCKFSFYVLKNHRSAVSRDTLVKTYVDVQPYAGKQKDAYYVALKNRNSPAPAPFFAHRPADEKNPAEKADSLKTPAIPSPVLSRTPAPVPEMQAKTFKRPPVVRPPVIKEEVKIKEETAAAPAESVSIDELMTAGLNLLNESDKTAAASELLLEEEAPVPAKTQPVQLPAFAAPAAKTAAVKSKTPAVKTAAAKKTAPDTHWVDIAALRRRIEEENAPARQKTKEETIKANAALLELNGGQVAAVNTGIATDSEPAEAEKTAPAAAIKTAVVQDIPFAGTEKPEESANKAEAPVQTAVVQDTPFAGTQEQPPAAENKPDRPLFLTSKEQVAAMAGDSPGLWKIAKARGVPKNSLAVKHGEFNKAADTPAAEKSSLSAAADVPKPLLSQTPAEETGPTVIYRNGRIKHVFGEEKELAAAPAAVPEPPEQSLDWFDRQEAAVWTSMSQSDAPSVWSAAAEPDDGNTDRARAFRVADEQPAAPAGTAALTGAASAPVPAASSPAAPSQTPAPPAGTAQNAKKDDNVVSSTQVRIVGEEQKPEAKENPILMPLGGPAAIPAASQLPPVNPAIQAPAVNPGGLAGLTNIPQSSPAGQSAAEGSSAEEDPGLMNKLFSFFGKTETPAVPNIGSGTPVPEDSDKKTDSKKDGKEKKAGADKQAQAGTAAARQADSRQDKVIIPTELRLTFKPDSTEISAQSVKWIKAFGQRAKKDIQSAVEVRMSNTNPVLQEKRFALIRSTLVGAGMSDVQILPVMTDRTPHTIVLRMLDLPEEGISEYTTSEGGIKERLYYKQW